GMGGDRHHAAARDREGSLLPHRARPCAAGRQEVPARDHPTRVEDSMSARGRLRSNDRLREFGEARIPVMVTWYSQGSSQQKPERILRVLLDPRGWHIVGDDFRTDPQTWLDATRPTLEDGTPADLDARDAGKVAFTDLRRFAGFDESMPIDTASWPTGRRFYVGTG